MSFSCSHCGFYNTEIQSAGEINKHGVKFTFKPNQLSDLQRQVVKSDAAVFRVEDVDLEIPPGKGRLTNIEGILQAVAEDLARDQPLRKLEQPDTYHKLEAVIESVNKIRSGEQLPCIVSLDDPTGNSWIEPSLEDIGPAYTRSEYPRSAEQNVALGLASEDLPEMDRTLEGVDILDGGVASHLVQCPGCGKDAMMNIQLVNIPYFKQVYITAIACESCGYKTNDVKTGGEIPSLGQRLFLEVLEPADLRRDILKSETCNLKIPECKVEVQPGTMGGRFTTVEGLLTQVRDDLRGSIFDDDDVSKSGGDSMTAKNKTAWTNFFSDLDRAIRGDMKFSIIMEDPLANSYIQSMTAPMPDPQLKAENYERSPEEEEDLGLLDMRTHLNTDGEYVNKQPTEDEIKTKP